LGDATEWLELAKTYQAEGHPTAALGAARRAVRENPRSLIAQLSFASLCAEIGYGEEAIAAYEAARWLAPLDAGILRRLADACRRAGRAKEALVVADTAAQFDPHAAATYVCLGEALLANDEAPAADRMFSRALAIDPRSASAECGHGAVHLAGARWHEARASFERALDLEPGCAEARYNRALIDLRCGSYRAGYAGYPAIMDTVEQRPRYHYYREGVPLWDGAHLTNRRLVVAYEQGLGNQIMMARFFNQLQQFGGSVAIEAPPAMLALLRRNFPGLSFVSFTGWQPLENMDVHLPLMQLPTALNVVCESNVKASSPYLSADSARVEALRGCLQLEAGVRHIGIAWHGNRSSQRDRWRAAPLAAWAPLAMLPDVRFHSLQFDATAAELAAAPFALAPAHEHIRDMDDTAALVCLMDRVVTVDTVIVHLAGALGRPVTMPESFLSEYRWGIDRTDSPWYPTLRIVRQRAHDDLRPVFNEIADQLRVL
jgi:tetratricopeptide (TPR) repeat protein